MSPTRLSSAFLDTPTFVSRGGLKLHHALAHFPINPLNLRCADFGCNVGGFTDCLLQANAAHVTAIDTGYGALAWKLRNDPRVRVLERTNALHAPPPTEQDRFDLIVIDMGWTIQARCIPAALAWLKPSGRIITLIKPHYEHSATIGKAERAHPVLDPAHAQVIVDRVLADLPTLGVTVVNSVRSPIEGGASKGNRAGNAEWLALLAPLAPSSHVSGTTAEGS